MPQWRFWQQRALDTLEPDLGVNVFEPTPMLSSLYGQVAYNEAMTLTAVWAAMREISETIASLPLEVVDAEGQPVENHPLMQLLQGNSLNDGYSIREQQVMHLILTGNSYSELEYSVGGLGVAPSVIGIYPFPPDEIGDVVVERGDGNRYIKRFRLNNASATQYLTEDKVFHIAGSSWTGYRGLSPIEVFPRTLSLATEIEKYALRFFTTGRPLGILKVSSDVSTKNMKTMQDAFVAANTGKNALGVVMMPDGAEYESISAMPDEAQFNDTRKELIQEIARVFRIPPSRLGYGEYSTYSNLQQDNERYVRDCLTPITRRIEAEYRRRFLMLDDLYLRHNFEELLEGDAQNKAEMYINLVNGGILSPNEARTALGYPEKEGLDDPARTMMMNPNSSNMLGDTAEGQPDRAGREPRGE